MWLYELSNVFALSLGGGHAYLTLNGAIPTSVAFVSEKAASLLPAKILQTALCLAAATAAVYCSGQLNLRASKLCSVVLLGSFLASLQWEFLSEVSTISSPLHIGLFLATSVGAGLLVLRFSGDPLFSDHGWISHLSQRETK